MPCMLYGMNMGIRGRKGQPCTYEASLHARLRQRQIRQPRADESANTTFTQRNEATDGSCLPCPRWEQFCEDELAGLRSKSQRSCRNLFALVRNGNQKWHRYKNTANDRIAGQRCQHRLLRNQPALLKLGVRVLLLAPSNADAARNHLLSVCGAVGIVVQTELLCTLDHVRLPVVLLQSLDDVFHVDGIEKEPLRFSAPDVWESHSFIIHSSGTTGLPKPIIHTHRSMMMIARMYRLFPGFAINNWYLAFPLYHIAGISIALSGLPNGLALTLPPPDWPQVPFFPLSVNSRRWSFQRNACIAPQLLSKICTNTSLTPPATSRCSSA